MKPHPWRKYSNRWTHNVQIVRFAFPPLEDYAHHARLVAFNRELEELLAKHDLPRKASFIGFYRANADWDNVDKPTACVNCPDRGSNVGGLDNEP